MMEENLVDLEATKNIPVVSNSVITPCVTKYAAQSPGVIFQH